MFEFFVGKDAQFFAMLVELELWCYNSYSYDCLLYSFKLLFFLLDWNCLFCVQLFITWRDLTLIYSGILKVIF